MANNDIIRHSDIAEDGVMKPLQDELIATIKILNTLDADIIKIATDLKKALSNPDNSTTAGLNATAAAARLANQAMTEREKVLKATRDAEAKLNEVISQESQELARLRLELQRANAENKNAAKEQSITTGAYEKASLELQKVRRQWKDLAIAQMENTDAGKALKKQLDELDAALKKVDADAGQHNRHVGNYASGFDGLQNSINQVTREFPAFTNSAQTGFMALSNNIPILVDQISQLRAANQALAAQGQATVPVWRQLVRSFLSWGTALSVGITIITVYGKEIGDFFMQLFEGKKVFDELKTTQEQVNDVQKRASESIADETASIEQLINIATAENASKEQKIGAIRTLNELSPEYLGNITEETLKTGEAKAAIDEYLKSLRAKAMAEAFQAKRTELQKKLIDAQVGSQSTELALGEKILFMAGLQQKAYVAYKDRKDGEIELINKEIDSLENLERKYINTGEVQIDLSKQKEADAKEAERLRKERERAAKEAAKKAEQAKIVELELQHKINQANLKALGDGLAVKKGTVLEELAFDQAMNEIKIKDKKKVLELNIALEKEARQKLIEIDRALEDPFEISKPKKLKTDTIASIQKDIHDKKKAELDAKMAALKEEQKLINQATKLIENAAKKRQDIVDNQIKNEIDANQKRQQDLRALAQKGVQDADNNLAFEQRKAAELEARKIKNERNKVRTQLIADGLKAYSANLTANPNGAVKKTLTDITSLIAGLSALPSFYDGTENTGIGGSVDSKGGFHAILHPNERVVTADQNKKIGDITNEQLANLAFMYQLNPTSFDRMPMSRHYNDDGYNGLSELNKKMDVAIKTIANRPQKSESFDEVSKMIVTTIRTEHKTVINRKKMGGRRG